MKKLKFFLSLFLILGLVKFPATAQDYDDSENPANDPLLKYKKVSSLSYGIGTSHLQTTGMEMALKNDFVYLNKARPGFEMLSQRGQVIRSSKDTGKVSGIYIWGFGFRVRQAALLHQSAAEYIYREFDFFVPVKYNFRNSLNRKLSRRRYNAVETGLGAYLSVPLMANHYERTHPFPNYENSLVLNTIRFGVVMDLSVSFLNAKAHGDVTGIRMGIDLLNSSRGETKLFNRAPLFIYSGIFYNIMNGARK